MILINLLPPELRRRTGGLSPVMTAILVGGLVNLLILAFFLWIAFVRVPAAKQILVAKQAELASDHVKAAQVLAIETKISRFTQQRDTIVHLLAQKVYWAKTQDDFASLLNGRWSTPGFSVCVGSLAIKPRIQGNAGIDREDEGSGSVAKQIFYDFTWTFKLVGLGNNRSYYNVAGDYMKSFLQTTEKSVFWTQDGFVGKPESRYSGDKPEWNTDIDRIVVVITLDWQRMKTLVATDASAGRARN